MRFPTLAITFPSLWCHSSMSLQSLCDYFPMTTQRLATEPPGRPEQPFPPTFMPLPKSMSPSQIIALIRVPSLCHDASEAPTRPENGFIGANRYHQPNIFFIASLSDTGHGLHGTSDPKFQSKRFKVNATKPKFQDEAHMPKFSKAQRKHSPKAQFDMKWKLRAPGRRERW
jgi:hypothetical protein